MSVTIWIRTGSIPIVLPPRRKSHVAGTLQRQPHWAVLVEFARVKVVHRSLVLE